MTKLITMSALLSFTAFARLNEARLSGLDLAGRALQKIGPPWAPTEPGEAGLRAAILRFTSGAPDTLMTGPLSPEALKSLGLQAEPVTGAAAAQSGTVILVAGLDNRPGDLSKEAQAELLAKGLGGVRVVPVRYTDLEGAKAAVSQNPGARLVLFSAGCSFADELAPLLKSPDQLWILEPYAVSARTVDGIQKAVSAGMPESHVVVGPSRGRGLGAVAGAQRTPDGTGHFDSLRTLGEIMQRP
jgi:hypothetical protein